MAKKFAGETLTADDWRSVLKTVAQVVADFEEKHEQFDPIKDTSSKVLRRAQQEYAEAKGLTADEVATLDVATVLGSYYFDQYEAAADDRFKVRGLPYPVQLSMSRSYSDRLEQLIDEQPANPFLKTLPALQKCVLPFACRPRVGGIDGDRSAAVVCGRQWGQAAGSAGRRKRYAGAGQSDYWKAV